jgi:hypothetical protein
MVTASRDLFLPRIRVCFVVRIRPARNERKNEMTYDTEHAAAALKVKSEVISRAVELGALVLDADGLISDSELTGFGVQGFKQHRYDEQGNKKDGVKS